MKYEKSKRKYWNARRQKPTQPDDLDEVKDLSEALKKAPGEWFKVETYLGREKLLACLKEYLPDGRGAQSFEVEDEGPETWARYLDGPEPRELRGRR